MTVEKLDSGLAGGFHSATIVDAHGRASAAGAMEDGSGKAARDGCLNVARKGVSRGDQSASDYGTVFVKWST